LLVPARQLLTSARDNGYAIGAFNVYNLEGALAVIGAAVEEDSPVMLQLHPGSLRHGGGPLISLCLTSVREAAVPAAVHLDHSSAEADIRLAVQAGCESIMADGSALPYAQNIEFTGRMAALVHAAGGCIEAELGRLSGKEDGLAVEDREARMTDPGQAADFAEKTSVDSLAVCIGNVHGHYSGEPRLDFERLASIRRNVNVPLVLHGASGLPEEMVRRSIELGVAKFNVNTELRGAYIESLRHSFATANAPELVDVMKSAVLTMQGVARAKLRLFNSTGRARSLQKIPVA
jgi:tagatose 1,6-diphosphate aldolase GatY/KbaY